MGGDHFSKSTVSEICKELDVSGKRFKERLLPEKYPFLIADAIYMKVWEEHRIRSKTLFLVIGVNGSGHKEIVGFDPCDSETTSTWKRFFENLKSRGLRGVDIVTSDAHAGLVEAICECFPGASWQRCQADFTGYSGYCDCDMTPFRDSRELPSGGETHQSCHWIEMSSR